ncbi:MAG: hypothetical protein KDC02_18850, partial [Flavobacteriales bacterium]|nr:hypothetical protein [Flavobacteriales bacterium]
IAPARLNVVQANERLYKGFVKAGFGTYSTPLGELYYDATRAKDKGYGIHLKHFSSNGGIKDVGPSQYGFNSVDAFYKTILSRHELKVGADYGRRRVNYYGYRTEAFDTLNIPSPSTKDIRQFYNDLGFQAKVKSLYTDSTKLAHEVGLQARHYTNRQGSRETNILVDADVHMDQGSETYGGRLIVDNNAYRGVSDDELTPDFRQNGTIIGLSPSVSTSGKRYVVRVGAGLYLDAMSKTTFHFYPQAYLSYSLFDDILVPYAGVDGERQRNSFRSLTKENPWLIPAPGLANTSKLYDIYGGMRGSLSSRIGFDVRVSTSSWRDRALFITDGLYSFGNAFNVLYDKVNVLNVSGDVSYDDERGTRFHARLDIFSYDTEDQAEAWNLPPYQLTIGARYSLREKLIVKLDAMFMGQRKALTPVFASIQDEAPSEVEIIELNGFFDLYLGVEYRYTKRLSLFLDMSNISASKYERWARYPVQRALILLGASYAF